MLLTRPRVVGLVLGSLALVVSATACTPASPSTPAGPASSAPASSAPAGGTLDFATVEKITAPALQKDPNCAYGQWNENSTGVQEEFRAAVTFFRQFDCYASKEDVGGIPKRLQQADFATFKDAATATKWAKATPSYPSLVAGDTVVMAGTGLESIDMPAYLEQLKSACGCGEVLKATS